MCRLHREWSLRCLFRIRNTRNMTEVVTLFPCLLKHPVYLFHVFTLLPPPSLFSSFKELKWSSELISSRLYKPLNRFCSSKQTIIQYPTNKQTNSRARKQTVYIICTIHTYLVPIIKPHSEHFIGNYLFLRIRFQKPCVSIFGTLF